MTRKTDDQLAAEVATMPGTLTGAVANLVLAMRRLGREVAATKEGQVLKAGMKWIIRKAG